MFKLTESKGTHVKVKPLQRQEMVITYNVESVYTRDFNYLSLTVNITVKDGQYHHAFGRYANTELLVADVQTDPNIMEGKYSVLCTRHVYC